MARLQFEWREAAIALGLSRQQVRIIALVMQGKTDKEIAAELSLSKYTVRTYLKRIFARLEVSDRIGLVLAIVAGSRPVCSHLRCPYKE
jgi:DNA-binding NarL/FixJ family response regulator